MNELEKYLEIALEAARAAVGIVKKNFGGTGEHRVKEDAKGLVTQTDLEAEKAILNILSAKTTFSILSEESGLNGNSNGAVWVVDPLDGTNNFAHSMPFFAVSVALMEGNESLVGVIIDPVLNNEYYAVKGGGAFLNGKRIKLPDFSSEYIPTLFLNHGYEETDRNKFKELARLLASGNNILKLGTTALELCYLANGSADGFICSGDEIWDFAAGMVIAREAGCVFTDWQGNQWNGENNHLLICRSEIHQTLIHQIKKLQ